MNVYEATMKAADWIEKNPQLYDFQSYKVPDCGTPGCLVGHIGRFMGNTKGTECWLSDAVAIIGVNSDVFMCRLDKISAKHGVTYYTRKADKAAKILRLYAAEHLSPREEKKKETPDWMEFIHRPDARELQRRTV